MNRKQQATAYHEAGHAFADWHFGYKVKKATIVPKDDSLGHVVTISRLHFRSLEYSTPSGARIGRFHERIVSLLAGHAAQRRFCPRSVRFYHASSDNQAADELLCALHSAEEKPHVWRYLQAKAKNLVEKPMHWRAIQHLAESLLKSQTLTGEQVGAAIKEGFDSDFQRRIAARNQKTA